MTLRFKELSAFFLELSLESPCVNLIVESETMIKGLGSPEFSSWLCVSTVGMSASGNDANAFKALSAK